jgi:hypothetical protein
MICWGGWERHAAMFVSFSHGRSVINVISAMGLISMCSTQFLGLLGGKKGITGGIFLLRSWGSRITRRSYSNIKTLGIVVIKMMAPLSGIRERCHSTPCCTPSRMRKVLDCVTVVIDCRMAGKEEAKSVALSSPAVATHTGSQKDC